MGTKEDDTILALGTVATARATTVGTGTSRVSARLECRVSVADDASALLCLAPVPDIGNAADVETEDGQLTTDSSDSNDDVLGDGRQRQPQYDAGIETAAIELDVGEYVDVGLVVDTPSGSAGSAVLKDGQTVTINANADEGELADVFNPVYDP